MKRVFLIMVGCLYVTHFLYAENALAEEGEKYLDKTRKATGDITENVSNGKVTEDKVGGHFDNYMDTVIWNDTYLKKTNRRIQVQTVAIGTADIPLDTPLDKLNAEWKVEEQRLQSQREKESNQTKEISTRFAGGYCTFEEVLLISKFNEYGKMDCLLDFGQGAYRQVEVFASFYPDYKREMVIALPMYMTFRNENRATFSGVVLKSNKTSINLASWVDNKRIRKMFAEGLLVSNDIVYNYVSGYMRALQLSRTRTGVEYITTTDPQTGLSISTPVATTKTAPPEVKDYVISAGVELLSSIFSIVGKDYLDSTEPLFKVYPQKLYVEGIVSFDNVGLAKRFGKISDDSRNKALHNNEAWEKKKENIIQKHERNYGQQGGTMLGGQ